MESKNKKLRSGYTTGACAAAAAKAAAMLVLRNAPAPAKAPGQADRGISNEEAIRTVEIPFPNGSRVTFNIHRSEIRIENTIRVATASVIKNAGDDPDVTHGAEICAEVSLIADVGSRIAEYPEIVIRGGIGVGRVTKPGLANPVGEPAINPVPRKMILDAVHEGVRESGVENQQLNPQPAFHLQPALTNLHPAVMSGTANAGCARAGAGRIPRLEVTISVPAGEELAKKTLNHRLGIVGGISILGTTGIVRPVSAEAWTATITASMDVAKAAGLGAVVISSGRTSEKAHMKKYHFPDEAYAMMGDYVEFALKDAKRHGFREAHFCAQWAKMVKTAMGTPQTHVRHGALEAEGAAEFLVRLGIDIPRGKAFNTSREIYDYIYSAIPDPQSAMTTICTAAKRYAEGITSGIPVIVHLVSYEGDILAQSE